MNNAPVIRTHRDHPSRKPLDGRIPPETVRPDRAPLSCAEAGVCQARKIPCLDCDLHPWPDADDSLTPMEQISTWVAYAVVVLATVVLMCIAAGYSYSKWFAYP